MHIILHGGVPKTATTALQAFFEANVDVLEHGGIYYPSRLKSTRRGNAIHQNLMKLRYASDAEPYQEWIKTDLNRLKSLGYKQILLSNEDIAGRAVEVGKPLFFPSLEKSLSRLRPCLEGYELQTILFTRDYLETLRAWYGQYIKMGGTESALTAFSALDTTTLNWQVFIDRFNQEIPSQSQTIRTYEELRADSENTIKDAFSGLLIDWSTIDFSAMREHHNISYTPNTLLSIRMINKVLNLAPIDLKRKLQKMMRRKLQPFLAKHVKGGTIKLPQHLNEWFRSRRL